MPLALTTGIYLPKTTRVRRKPGTLLPLEVAILRVGLELQRTGEDEFYGYLLASSLKEAGESRTLTAHGTLYKALDRMKTAGLLSSRWEDAAVAEVEERPRRKLYRVTAEGARAYGLASEVATEARFEPGYQPG